MRAFWTGLALMLALGIASLCAPEIVQAQAPATLDEYRRVVDEVLALTRQANALPVDERRTLLTRAAAKLDGVRTVQLPSGASTSISNTSLVALLRDPNRTGSAIARLTALRTQLDAPHIVPNPQDLQVLRELLNRPPFAAASSQDWITILLDRLSEFLSRLYGNTARGVFDARDYIVLAGAILVCLVIAFFVRSLRRNLVPEQALDAPAEDRLVRTPAEAFDAAQRAVARGDYRNAVRQLYLATLLILDQRGKLKYDPTLTNREYLTQSSSDPTTTAALSPIVETFDRTWYGFEPLTRQEFDVFKQRVERVRDL